MVQNNTVIATDDNPMGAKATNTNQVPWLTAAKDKMQNDDETPIRVYAQTGTSAVQRKPVMRVWNTIGVDGVGSDASQYYMSGESDVRQLNVHVENRYWWNDTAVDLASRNGAEKTELYERRTHTYSVDGGQRGSIPQPAVTVVLPENLAPVNAKTNRPYARLLGVAQPFEHTDASGAREADWSLNIATDATSDSKWKLANNQDVANNLSMYDATVTYEAVDDAGTPIAQDGITPAQCRFVVRFTARSIDEAGNAVVNGPATGEHFIKSNDMETFKFKVVTLGDRVASTQAELNTFQNIRTFVTSAVPAFKFFEDQDIAQDASGKSQNPYRVGNAYQMRYKGDTSDKRLDSRVTRVATDGVVYSSTQPNAEKLSHQPQHFWHGKNGTAIDYTFAASATLESLQRGGTPVSYFCGLKCTEDCTEAWHQCSVTGANACAPVGGCTPACNSLFNSSTCTQNLNPVVQAGTFQGQNFWPYVPYLLIILHD